MPEPAEVVQAGEHRPQRGAAQHDIGVAAASRAARRPVLAGLQNRVKERGCRPEQAVAQAQVVPGPGSVDIHIDRCHLRSP